MIKPTFYRWDRPRLWPANFKAFLQWLKQFFVRGAKGWCYADVWCLNDYLVNIILPCLKELKEIEHGYPVIDDSLNEEEAIALWDQKLDAMIEGFEAAKRILNDEWQTMEDYKIEKAIFKRGMKEFTEYFFALWD